MGRHARAATEALTRVLDDAAFDVVRVAASALVEVDEAPVPKLKLALKRGTHEQQQAVCEALRPGLAGINDLVPTVLSLARDPNGDVRAGAMACLNRIEARGEDVVRFWTRELRHKDSSRRYDAADSLGEWGRKARAALPELRAAPTDRHYLVWTPPSAP